MRHYPVFVALIPALCAIALIAFAATVVPTDVMSPGTQPGETSGLESPDKCDNCHGGYDSTVEPAWNWRGSMMAQATRDPLYWATVAIAEQDFEGAGDFCIRCHSPDGWLAGRSTPTDGSGLNSNDMHGVSCDLCHAMVNPDESEHPGVQNPPFVANDGSEGYYGSGQFVVLGTSHKLGPYANTKARHQSDASLFHRDSALCGTCHDVSNPVTGDLAHNNGAPVTFSGVPGAPVADKAAFNNPPYAYGVVERTYSEHVSSLWDDTPVSDYASLPPELQDGVVEYVRNAALVAGNGGDYEDGTTRYFTCQTCHMPPVTGVGCNKKGSPVRDDLPLHDMTGGNYWAPEAIGWQDDRGLLVIGGGMTSLERAAMEDGAVRSAANLTRAASLSVQGDVVTVVNLTGHKLISGYPEGRRMWLNVRWYDAGGALIDEDGAYGDLQVQIDGVPTTVRSLLDLDDDDLRIYEAHGAMTQEWAAQLLALGYDPGLPLTYDRITGDVDDTLGELAAEEPGDYEETFHFALNNLYVLDTRIPPYGMSYDQALERHALPVPADQYGAPGPGGTYDHFDEVALDVPANAAWADIELLYQPTSWEYVQFLYEANDGSVGFLAAEGANLLDAWLGTGMAEPVVMASTSWGSPACVPAETLEVSCEDGADNDCDLLVDCDDPDCATDAACVPSVCDGDGVCEPGEDCSNCGDCAGKTSGKPAKRFCCGNGVVESAEGNGAVCDGNH